MEWQPAAVATGVILRNATSTLKSSHRSFHYSTFKVDQAAVLNDVVRFLSSLKSIQMPPVAELLRSLSVTGIARPAALQAELGISPQTLSRLVIEAGDSIYRIGKARATQYARTRHIAGLGHALPVFSVDDNGRPVSAGTLRLLWSGRTYWDGPGHAQLFEGMPPELVDMAPQGYLGRGFSSRHPDLGLPQRLQDWSDDHRLIALARRGEDCVGNFIVGDESLQRFLESDAGDVNPESYPALALQSATASVGSSAGGERPKFGARSGGRSVLVKFARGGDSDAARRWWDLLWCEAKALQLITQAGKAASVARCLDVDGWRFLEVERFDRVGARGRRAALSLSAVSNEHLGDTHSWTAVAPRLMAAPLRLPAGDAETLRWLDVFGQLIGNTDRHFGNISFRLAPDGGLRLAPAYDMLPMILAPADELLPRRVFEPQPPLGSSLDVWEDASLWAERFWHEVRDCTALGVPVRAFAEEAATALKRLRGRLAPGA